MSYANAVQGFIDTNFSSYQVGLKWLKQYYRNPPRCEDQRIAALAQNLALHNGGNFEDLFIQFYFNHKLTPIKVVKADGSEITVPRSCLTKELKAQLRPDEKIHLPVMKEVSIGYSDPSAYVQIQLNNISSTSINHIQELQRIFKNIELVIQESCAKEMYKALFELGIALNNIKSIRFMKAFDFNEAKFLNFLRQNRSIVAISLIKISEMEGAALLMTLDERKIVIELTIAGTENFPSKWQLALISRDPRFLSGLKTIAAELYPHDQQIEDLYERMQSAASIKPRAVLKLYQEFNAMLKGSLLCKSMKALQVYRKLIHQFPVLNDPFYIYPVRCLSDTWTQGRPFVMDCKLAHAYSFLWEMGGSSFGITFHKYGFEKVVGFIQNGKLESEEFEDVRLTLACALKLFLGMDIIDTCRGTIMNMISTTDDIILMTKYVQDTLYLNDKVLQRFLHREHRTNLRTSIVNNTHFSFDLTIDWSINKAGKYDIKIKDFNCTAAIVLEEFLKDETLGSLNIEEMTELKCLDTLIEWSTAYRHFPHIILSEKIDLAQFDLPLTLTQKLTQLKQISP